MPGLGGISVQQAMDLYYAALPAHVQALPPVVGLGALPLVTAVLAVLLARWVAAAARALPVPTIEVPLNPGE